MRAAEFGRTGDTQVEQVETSIGLICRTRRDGLPAEDRYLAAEGAIRLPADGIVWYIGNAGRRRRAPQTGHADLRDVFPMPSSGSIDPASRFVS